jgi:fatty-acyl-CoA synthase/long-chain acyl-CoA synthetase
MPVDWDTARNAAGQRPRAHEAGYNTLCMLAYTSGTTGNPKGCMHTHGTMMSSAVGSQVWRSSSPESVVLAVAPMFHLLGMQNCMHSPIYLGATVVLMPRWDRALAADLIERYRVSAWGAPPAMLVDFSRSPMSPGVTCPAWHFWVAAARPCPTRWPTCCRSASACRT